MLLFLQVIFPAVCAVCGHSPACLVSPGLSGRHDPASGMLAPNGGDGL